MFTSLPQDISTKPVLENMITVYTDIYIYTFKPGKVTLPSSAAQPQRRKSVGGLHYSEISIHTPKLKDIMKKITFKPF